MREGRLARWAKGLFGITFGTAGANTFEESLIWARGGMADTPFQPFRQQATVATAISIIARDASSVDWEAYEENADDALERHDVLEFFRRPNAMMNGRQLWVGTYVSHELFGEAFWYYPDLRFAPMGVLDSAKRRTADQMLKLLDPRRVVHYVENGSVTYKLRLADGREKTLDPDWLTHFKRWNPYVPESARGLSRVESVILDVKGDYAAQSWNERFYSKQNGTPGGLLMPSIQNPGPAATPDQRREFLMMWNQRHGARRTVGMVPPGWDFKDLGMSQRDMDFRELREYSREQILAAFGVPPFLAGVLDKANYANAREQKEIYWHGTITGLLTCIGDTLNDDFLPKVGVEGIRLYPRWEIVKALTENLAEKVTIAKDLFAMGWTKRTINDRLDLGFDVDELDDPDTGYLPMGLAPVSLIAQPPPPATLPPSDVQGESDGEPAQRSTRELTIQEEHRRALVWRNIVARYRDLEAQFNRLIRSHIERLRRETMENLGGLKGWMAQHKAGGVTFFDVDEAGRELSKRTGPFYRKTFRRGGESVLADLGLSMTFDMLDPRVLARLSELTAKIRGFNERLERRLRKILVDQTEDGLDVQALADAVAEEFRLTATRSMTIARTETGMAFNGARLVGMQQAGINRHEWLSSRDPDVRDSHVGVDGEVRTIPEPFSNGLVYPQDQSGPPEEIINCRCTSIPVVGDGNG